MQFEDFDKKVREAADNHHPVYNENAWPQMEKLLDKHLPQKENNRRRFIFFLLLLLGLGGALWITEKTFNRQSVSSAEKFSVNNSTIAQTASDASNLKQTDAGIYQDEDKRASTNETDATTNTNTNTKAINNQSAYTYHPNSSSLSKITNRSDRLSFTTSKGNNNGQSVSSIPSDSKRESTSGNTLLTLIDSVRETPKSNAANTTGVNNSTKPHGDNTNKDETELKKGSDIVVDTDKPIVMVRNKVSSKTNRKGFAILFAAGVDKSSIGFAKAGTTKSIFGAGISYTYKKFTLSSGIYSGQKIYTAAPADYKFGYYPPNYTYLKSINADCNVLDIPVNIAWNFIDRKNGSWFVSSGVSSWIMKKEKYGYVYRYPNGQSYTHRQEYDNKNQHLFSTLNVSAGYKRYIGKSFFISAEPYLKLPVKGVGAGKINLHSSGIMITAGIQPFNSGK